MTKKLKLSALVSVMVGVAMGATAGTTNLLQSVEVTFTVFTQGTPVVKNGDTNNIIDKGKFDTKALIAAVSPTSNFVNGEMLVRATPVSNAVVLVTNLVPVWTNILVISNTSSSVDAISNDLIFNSNAPIYIGNTNVTYSTNTETIAGSVVTLGTNVATVGTNTNAVTVTVGTNTTVTVTVITNAFGFNVGTSNVFVSETITNVPSSTNVLGTASWDIYTPAGHHTPATLTPISTNVIFNIFTDTVHDDSATNAIIHGETIGKNHVVKFGTTDEIRAFVLSNASWNIRLDGYSQGHYVTVNLGGNDDVYSQDYNWTGSGSGLSNSVPTVIEGGVTENYFKFLTQ
jgi:hypothetical protein